MVNPLYLIAILLASAFLHPLIGRRSDQAGRLLVTSVLVLTVALPIHWLLALDFSTMQTVVFHTAGFTAPLSINLRLGVEEALVLLIINGGALLSALYAIRRSSKVWEGSSQILLMTLVLGVNGLVLGRDLFNMFVFMEISSLSLYALVATTRTGDSFEAGIKLMVAGGISSALFLIGVVFLYRITGTLNLDEMVVSKHLLEGKVGITALSLMVISLLIELKPFPANGWGADVYQAADPNVSSLISGTSATAFIFVLYKITPLLDIRLLNTIAISGGVTFIASQFVAYKQDSIRRMLGFSSIGQVGLLVLVVGLGGLGLEIGGTVLSQGMFFVILLLVANHLLSKTGLFWMSGVTNQTSLASIRRQGSHRLHGAGIGVQGVLTSALAGFPPFPAFWAKFLLVTTLITQQLYGWAFVILLGSLVESAYLFKWFLSVQKSSEDPGTIHDEQIPSDFQEIVTGAPIFSSNLKSSGGFIAPVLSACLLSASGLLLSLMFIGTSLDLHGMVLLLPLLALVLWTLLDMMGVPFRLQIGLAFLATIGYALVFIPRLHGIALIFGLLFIVGSAVQMIPLFIRRGVHRALAGMLVALVFSLGNLLFANSSLEFFFSWELMTITSFFLVVRGKHASGASLRYLVFSLSGAFSILAGLALESGPIGTVLLGIGFLIKMGALGFHIWLPAAYAEADDDLSTFFSSILSKAGLLMMFVFAGLFAQQVFSPELLQEGRLADLFTGFTFSHLLGWLGACTAFAGAFLALFKEDIKYTLAYSSMGQVGYMLLSFALMTQLGWMNSLYLAITHALFKGMLFIAIGGVVYRTKTRMMYQMGGLISRMPLTFLTVLIGIIAVSGVPPLTGFGAKWMLYTALIEKGWYLQAALAMFASGIAFLYLFRLIHTIFLGQLKDAHRDIKEAPLPILIPQIIGIVGIMIISMYPTVLLKPLEAAVAPYFERTLEWSGYTVLSTLGYWNGTAVMYVTMGVFIVPLAWLLIVQRKHTQKVGQFNIVYAAERPYRPETTHFGYNFFSPYEKALGFLLHPSVTRFWHRIVSIADVFGGMIRRLYSGNIQTYVLWIVLYFSILLLLVQRGV